MKISTRFSFQQISIKVNLNAKLLFTPLLLFCFFNTSVGFSQSTVNELNLNDNSKHTDGTYNDQGILINNMNIVNNNSSYYNKPRKESSNFAKSVTTLEMV